MYIFLNKGIKMSKGKIAVQAAHAAILAYQISKEDIKKKWDETSYVKIMLEALGEKHIYATKEYLKSKEINSVVIADEGRTEVEPGSVTALGIEILDREKYKEILGGFKLY